MKTETKILGIGLLVTLLLLVGAVVFLTQNQTQVTQTPEGAVYEIDYSKGQKIGSDSAKVKLAEFSDFQCPFCAQVEPFVKQALGENVQLIYFHFPLSGHKNARAASRVSEAAATEGKFWEMHDKLFETQKEWENLNDPTSYFIDLGKQLGVSGEKIKQALTSSTYEQTITEDYNEGLRVGVNSTPSFYINGKKVNLQSYDDLKRLVQEELNK